MKAKTLHRSLPQLTLNRSVLAFLSVLSVFTCTAQTVRTGPRTQVLRQASERPKLSVQLLLNEKGGSQNSADGFTAIFDESFSKSIGDEDSYKFTNLDENMAIDRDGVALSIEGRPIIDGNDTIPLRMWQFRQKNYFLTVTGVNFASDLSAYIKDAFLHIETPINLNGKTVLPFSLSTDASSARNRFSIIFKESKTLPVLVTDVKASRKNEQVSVEWTSHTETNIDRYEVERSVDGVNFSKEGSVSARGNNSTAQLYEWLDEFPVTGNNLYRVKVIEKSGEVKYTSIGKVNIANRASSIRVYPNPVKGNTFTVSAKNLEKGKYAVMLYNNMGQVIFNTFINRDGGNIAYPVTAKVIKGSYQLFITNGSNIKQTQLLIFE